MRTLSFRVEDDEAAAAQRWSERIGVDRSELLREALHAHLARLANERDAEVWDGVPATDTGLAFASVTDWGRPEV